MKLTFAIEIEELLNKALIEKAITLCRQGISEFPDYPAAYYLLAKAFAIKGDLKKSEEVLTTANELFPTNVLILKAMDEGFDTELDTPIEIAEEESHPPVDEYDEIANNIDEQFEEHDEYDKEIGDETPSVEIREDIEEDSTTIDNEQLPEEISLDEIITQEELPKDTSSMFSEEEEYTIEEETFAPDDEMAKDSVVVDFTETDSLPEKEYVPDDVPFLKLVLNKHNDTLEHPNLASDLSLIPGLQRYKFSTTDYFNKEHLNPPSVKMKENLMHKDDSIVESTASKLNDIQKIKITELAEEIKKFSGPREEMKYEKKESSPISDTLATIYESQGAYGEAIKAYRSLIEKNPDKEPLYMEKIEALKQKMVK